MVQFGSVSIPASCVNQLRHKKDTILAADLCSVVFTPQEMALCSMEGKVNNKYGLLRKYPIDKSKVEAIVGMLVSFHIVNIYVSFDDHFFVMLEFLSRLYLQLERRTFRWVEEEN